METQYDIYSTLLKDAVVSLALTPQHQIDLGLSGCLACNLLNDYYYALKDFKDFSPNPISDEEKVALDQVLDVMHEMTDEDHVCFDNSVLFREKWDSLRSSATKARRVFGW